MIDDNKKRLKAVGTAAVLGLAVPLAVLYWMWPAEKPPALETGGAPGRIIPFPIDKITEEEAGKTIVTASDFSLVAPTSSGEFTTESGFGGLITMPTSGDDESSVPVRQPRLPGNMAVATVGSGMAGPSGGTLAGRQRAPSGPIQVARVGGGGGAAGGGLPYSSASPEGGTNVPGSESTAGEPLLAIAEEPDLLREPADGPVPQAVACANEAAGLSQAQGEPAGECEPGAQLGSTPASPTRPVVPPSNGGGKQVVDTGGGGQGGAQDPAGTGDSGSGAPEWVDEGNGGSGENPDAGTDTAESGKDDSGGSQETAGGGEPEAGEGGGAGATPTLLVLNGEEPGAPISQNLEEVVQANAVPGPGSLLLAMTALAGFGVARRKSRR